MEFNKLPSDEIINRTATALNSRGLDTKITSDGEEAKNLVLSLIPDGAEIMNMPSKTLEAIGIAEVITDSGKYNPVRTRLMGMNRETQSKEMNQLGAAPDWCIGSVHAITQDGSLFIASKTGSQLPAEAFGAAHVIFVAGAQKIVADFNEGLKRIYEYSLPLESERANKAYNITSGSAVNKLLVINGEINPKRITVIIIKQVLGF